MLKLLSPLLGHPDYRAGSDPFYFSRSIRGLRSPMDLPDMDRAVEFLSACIKSKGHILILGDRDVDGVSSTALLGNFLKQQHLAHGGRLTIRVSDQGDDYGLSGDLYRQILSSDADLVFLLDMGSSHGPEIHELAKTGKRIIVLDHHQVSKGPDHTLCAFVNPQRNPEMHENGGKIPTVGLAFKFLFGYALSFLSEWDICIAVPVGHRLGLYKSGSLCKIIDSLPSTFEGRVVKMADAPTLEFIRLELAARSTGRQNGMELGVLVGSLLVSRMIEARPRLKEFLMMLCDLVSVGIITDMVPLTGENRALVRIGLGSAGMRVRPSFKGYKALIDALDLPKYGISGRDLAWTIGPTLNAAGRMGNTALAINLLTSDDDAEAKKLASELKSLNRKRQERTRKNEEIVVQHLASSPARLEQPIIFCYHPELEPGVSGIMATRLLEQYGKPVIFVNRDGEHARGSARADGMNVLPLLDQASHLFIQFGGHPEAAGFSVHYDRIDELESTLVRASIENPGLLSQEQKDIRPVQHITLKPSDLGRRLHSELMMFEPFGPGNPEPVILLLSCTLRNVTLTKDERHAKFSIAGSNIEFVAWRMSEHVMRNKDVIVDIYGCLERSRFAGRDRLQFRVESIAPAAVSAPDLTDSGLLIKAG